MCTVTFIPAGDTVFITSNRDEKLARKKAIHPKAYRYNGCRLLGPVDAAAGGTWIALKENGDAAVLLNGAFLPHNPQPPYRMSRGIVFLDLLTASSPSLQFSIQDARGIEPFTLILFEAGSLYQFRWDGRKKHIQPLPANEPHIWSSVTLYRDEVIRKRENWFARFLREHPAPTHREIFSFHQFGGDGDAANDLLMKRGDVYATVSITSIESTPQEASIRYTDLADNKETILSIAYPVTTNNP